MLGETLLVLALQAFGLLIGVIAYQAGFSKGWRIGKKRGLLLGDPNTPLSAFDVVPVPPPRELKEAENV